MPSTGVRGLGPYGSGDAGDCELTEMDSGNKLKSFGGTECAFNHRALFLVQSFSFKTNNLSSYIMKQKECQNMLLFMRSLGLTFGVAS